MNRFKQLLCFLLPLSSACGTAPSLPQPEDLPDEAVWMDVRTPAEYAADHVEGALLLPFDAIREGHPLLQPPHLSPGQTVLVYCRSGRRSAIAAARLTALGFTVHDLATLGRAKALHAARASGTPPAPSAD